MNFVKKAFLVLWRIWFYVLTGIPVIFLFPFLAFAASIPNGYKYVFWIARNIWAPFVLTGCGFWVKKINSFPDSKQAFVIIANHTSYIDVMVMLRISKAPFVFVGKKELVKIPFFGFLYKRSAIMVDRSNSKSRYGVYGRADKLISKGYSICIFPENNYLDETILLNPFKHGAFKIAIEYQMPIFPLVFLDCKRKFPWSLTHGFPGSLRVKFLDIIPTLEKTEIDINFLKEDTFKTIHKELLNDPKQASLEAISIWKKSQNS